MMTQSTKWTQFYITGDICIINSTSFNGRGVSQERTCRSWKLRYRCARNIAMLQVGPHIEVTS